MTEKAKHTAETRNTVVVSVDIEKMDANSPLFTKRMAEKAGFEAECYWVITEQTRHGTRPIETDFLIFDSEEAALEYLNSNPVGSVKDDARNLAEILSKNVNYSEILNFIDEPSSTLNVFGVPGEDGMLVWEVLKDSGLTDGYQLSPKVRDFLGKERVNKIKSIHGENWTAAAAMEYCFINLPSSSSAYIAAQQQYCYYIAGDDFAAGYLLRDLETLVHGVELAAQRALQFSERQAARAAKGGLANAQKAELRKATFFRIALANLNSWIWKSESEQRRFLKRLANEHDEELFSHGAKTLSDNWFDEMLATLRQSGELERVLSAKKP